MRHLYRSTLISVSLLAFVPAGLTAQTRSAVDALRIGAHRLATKDVVLRRWNDVKTYENTAYIVADTLSHRAVIVAADERMIPVLAELDKMPAEGKTLPPALCDMMDQYAHECDALQQGRVEELADRQPLAALPDVRPILTSTWGQSSPFNDDCPLGCPSGCVATAMAQIMYHYGYPAHGRGNHSYRTRSRQIAQGMDFDATYFDWQNMLPAYTMTATSAQRQAVATLMHACGVSVDMDYDSGGSGAYDFNIPYALINFFGYNPNTENIMRDYYTTDEWHRRLAGELTAGRPVLYCGQDKSNGGHAFIVDGCRSSDSKVHVNWGWDGEYDGYYVLSSLDPGRYRFSTYQSMVMQFSPELAGTHEDVAYADRFSVSGKLNGGGTIQATLYGLTVCSSATSYSISTARFNGYVGLGVWDSAMQFVGTLYEQGAAGWSIHDERDVSLRCTLRMAGLTDGTYYLAPYVRDKDVNEPTRVRTLHAQTDVVAFNVNGDNVSPDTPDPVPDAGGVVWQESFEGGSMPATVSESSIQGSGGWEVVQVLFSKSSAMPEAATGHGYAVLRNRGLGLSGQRVVNRLVTDDITLPADKHCRVSVKVRKHSTQPDSNDAMTIYAYTTDMGWQALSEGSVLNSSVWETITAELPEGLGSCRIAVEGSLGNGGTLFVDDLSVAVAISTEVVSTPDDDNRHSSPVYDIAGHRHEARHGLRPGIHIVGGRKVAIR